MPDGDVVLLRRLGQQVGPVDAADAAGRCGLCTGTLTVHVRGDAIDHIPRYTAVAAVEHEHTVIHAAVGGKQRRTPVQA